MAPLKSQAADIEGGGGRGGDGEKTERRKLEKVSECFVRRSRECLFQRSQTVQMAS